MSTVIAIDNVSKAYRLGTLGARSMQEDLQRWWARVRRRPDPSSPLGAHAHRFGEQFWALRNVSFEVKDGEVLGIIGRNGAGKSTLLKILSQVTAPTSGEVRVVGRVASLLEVGMGFHPDLTGRENVFLNGAILGMTKAEIRRKFDEIVAFSEIEQFIDTPVKRYSSGMYVRLAFAVAAHLEPEILIVDEVLAVGDAKFQRKCLGKMESVAALGRTVLFVSHNVIAIRRLCTTGVLLREGELVVSGEIESVLAEYEKDPLEQQRRAAVYEQPPKPDHLTVSRVAVVGSTGSVTQRLAPGEPFTVDITIHSHTEFTNVTIACSVLNRTGDVILTSHSRDVTLKDLDISKGSQTYHVEFDPNYFMPGEYALTIGVIDHAWNQVASEVDCLKFSIADATFSSSGAIYSRPGNVVIPYKWSRA